MAALERLPARHSVSESTFSDGLGSGRQVTVTCSGLEGKPDLVYIVQLYDQRPYGTVQVKVHNSTEKAITVQAIRSVEAIGEPLVDLGGRASADRILSDSFSEDWPDLRIYDLGKAPGGMHRGVGSQLIYNRESKQSLFLGALTSDRFLTLLHLQAEARRGDEDRVLQRGLHRNHGNPEGVRSEACSGGGPGRIELPVEPGEDMASERLMFEAGPDYHSQLLAYGDAIRRLHHARVSSEDSHRLVELDRLLWRHQRRARLWPMPTGRPNI